MKKALPNRRSTGELVLSAMNKLMKNTGWTTRTIIKFIKAEYGIYDSSISRKISRSLKRGVKLGILVMENGRYRLNNVRGSNSTVPTRQNSNYRRFCNRRGLLRSKTNYNKNENLCGDMYHDDACEQRNRQ